MKAPILASLLAAALGFSAACAKKEIKREPDPEPPAPVVYDNYTQLKKGNYWVYQRYQVQQSGQEQPLNTYDSSYIAKDTVLRGQTYFELHSSNYPYSTGEKISYLRDSLHYLISSSGAILFSSIDFTTVFSTSYIISNSGSPDTLYKVSTKMNDRDLDVQVPAGNFKTSSMQATYFAYPVIATPGVNNPRYLNTRYAKNMGIITETLPFFSGSSFVTERRLVRYHLN